MEPGTEAKDEQGEQIFYKGRNTWFVYEPAVELLRDGQVIDPTTQTKPQTNGTSAYTMRIELDTWLKQSTAQGSSLPDSQRQLVQAGPKKGRSPAGSRRSQPRRSPWV